MLRLVSFCLTSGDRGDESLGYPESCILPTLGGAMWGMGVYRVGFRGIEGYLGGM